MTDFNGSTPMADTPKTDSNAHFFGPYTAAESPPVETEVQSSTRIDEQVAVPLEMMQAEPSHGEPEQTEAERSSTAGPSMTQADAPADVPAEASAEPAPHEPNNASSDGLDAQVAWEAGLAVELARTSRNPLSQNLRTLPIALHRIPRIP